MLSVRPDVLIPLDRHGQGYPTVEAELPLAIPPGIGPTAWYVQTVRGRAVSWT